MLWSKVESQSIVSIVRSAFQAHEQTVEFNKHTFPVNSCEVAIMCLTDDCNGAATYDDVGFSKTDVEFGHSLGNAAYRYGRFTENQLRSVQRVKTEDDPKSKNGMIYKYRKQLESIGFDLEALLDQVPLPRSEKKQVDGWVKVKGIMLAESEKAFKVDHGTHDAWWPKSQLHAIVCGTVGDEMVFSAKKWLTEAKGLHV